MPDRVVQRPDCREPEPEPDAESGAIGGVRRREGVQQEHGESACGDPAGAAAVYCALVDEWLPAYVSGAVRWAVEATGLSCAFDSFCVRALSVMFLFCFVSTFVIAVLHGRGSPFARKVYQVWFHLDFCSYEPRRCVVRCCVSAYFISYRS